jgi:hypothetical protein
MQLIHELTQLPKNRKYYVNQAFSYIRTAHIKTALLENICF